MIGKIKSGFKKLEIGILELFLGIFIVIGIVGYFFQVSADLEWLDHTISFVLFTYLFYKLNITSLLLGKTNKFGNLLIVLSFFSLFFKDYILFTPENGAFNYLGFLDGVYSFIFSNLLTIKLISFYVGIAGLFFISVYLTIKLGVTHPSFIYAISKELGNRRKLIKFILIFGTLIGFYFFVYNTILEWLEFVLDDPIILVGIIFYFTRITKHYEKFHKNNFVFKIGERVEHLYAKFISLLHYKKTLPLAISGLLILHAFTDLGVYAYSYSVGKENVYLEGILEAAKQVGGEEAYLREAEAHRSFVDIYNSDIEKQGGFKSGYQFIFLILVYFLNGLSMVLFLLIPLVAWFKIFTHKNFHMRRILLPLIYSAMTAYVLMPSYILKGINNLFVGVDISTRSILTSGSVIGFFVQDVMAQVSLTAIISVVIGVLVFIISKNKSIRKELFSLSLIFGLVFYGVYFFNFFKSTATYLLTEITSLAVGPHVIIAFVMFILLILSIFFYVGGFITFIYEIVMEYHRNKWSDPIDEEIVLIINKFKSVGKKPKNL